MPRSPVPVLLAILACTPAEPSLPEISGDRLLADITVLAADSLEGRRPGTPGEERTVRFLTAQFAAAGLEPGNPDGSWTQPMTLVGITSVPTLSIAGPAGRRPLEWKTDYVAQSRREVPQVSVTGSELVFVGYGVSAPEVGWDDYKDVDVTGKTIVMLVGDPPVRMAGDTTALDPAVFRGEAMTYYGRWTYKYEEATRRGAAAALVVHQDGPAGYPWEIVQGGWTGERMDVTSDDGKAGRVAVEGWLSVAATRRLVADVGLDFGALEVAARTRDFRPVSLGASATFAIRNTLRTVNTHNVVARLPGGDAAVAGEHVIYTAHWDHFGYGEPVGGDSIYNGARDNASGTAALVELARAFAAGPAPRRSILFLAVTGEEQGLLGSKGYAEHPLYPLETTLADINVDVLNAWGPTADLVVVGMGSTTLEEILAEEAAALGRRLVADPEPEKGYFYRSDHFEFAKQGVPALYVDEGTDYLGKPAGYGEERRAAWVANIYHKPSDEVDPTWDMGGATADLALLYRVGLRVANGESWPTWLPGTEFKAVREAMLDNRP